MEVELQVGQYVRLTGLQARPDLNGVIGTLKEFKADKGRWAVKVHKSAEGEKLFKATNLVALTEEESAAFAELSAPETPEKWMVRLKAATEADLRWSEERGLLQKPWPKSRSSANNPFMWHLERNLCEGKKELANWTMKAMSLVTRHPDRKAICLWTTQAYLQTPGSSTS